MKLENEIINYIKENDILNIFNIMYCCRENEWYWLGIYLGRYFYNKIRKDININYNDDYKKFLEEYALCCHYSKKYKESNIIYNVIMNEIPQLNHEQLEHINVNNHFNWINLHNSYTYYNIDKIQLLTNNKNPNKEKTLSFSITTCKRLDLFIRTMNSFINCCIDIYLIDYWLCVDDNSSQEERDRMKLLYPFFDFYFKTPEEKGHPSSMNIIRNKITTPYLFHMEDDWEFYTENVYINNCLTILSSNSNIKQCLINKNYAETPIDIRIKGGFLKYTELGESYYVHEHVPKEKYQEFVNKYGNVPNCAYWTHYSFRPSIIKTEIFQLGEYITSPYFEIDYSYKYFQNGWESAFLPSIYCKHIGRLTSERGDTTKINAYDLNDEDQFDNAKRNKDILINEEGTYLFNNSVYQGITDINKKMKTYILNLDDREDRWNKMKRCNFGYIDYERYSAVNGIMIKPNIHLSKIFDGNDYNMRSGIVGCALSHIKMYIELVYSLEYEYFMILEDDIEIVKDFDKKIFSLFQEIDNKDFVYLGHHLRDEFITTKTYDKDSFPKYVKWDSITSLCKSLGGTGGYIISKTGARKLLEFIDKNGMTNGIDTVQQKAIDTMDLYYCEPHLFYSECYRGNNHPDSDIQYNYSSLSLDLDTRLEKELKFFNNEVLIIVYNFSQIPETLENNVILVYDDRNSNCMTTFLEKYPTTYILDGKIAIYFYDSFKEINRYIFRLSSYINGKRTYNINPSLKFN